jgi:hypothetical protein
MAAGSGKVDVGSLWTDPAGVDSGIGANASDPDGGSDGRLQGGRFVVDVSRKRAPLAVAAPGMH